MFYFIGMLDVENSSIVILLGSKRLLKLGSYKIFGPAEMDGGP